MDFLKKLGLKPKPRPHGLGDDTSQKKQNIDWIKTALIAAFLAGVILFYPKENVQEITYKTGQVWTDDDLIAPFTFSLLKTDSELEQERKQIVEQTSPIFQLNHDAPQIVEKRTDSIFNSIQSVLENFAAWKQSVKNERPQSVITRDSLSFLATRNAAIIGFNDEGWNGILVPYTQELVNYINSDREESIGTVYQELRLELITLTNRLLDQGIIDIAKSEIDQNEIIVRDRKNRTERARIKSNVYDLSEARSEARSRLSQVFGNTTSASAIQLFNLVIEPNLIFSLSETQQRIEESLSSISPTKGAVAQGQMIIRKGDLITKERLNMLQSLTLARSERASDLEIWKQNLGQILIIFSILMVFMMYIYLYRKAIFEDNLMLLLLFLLILFVLGINAFLSYFDDVSPYVTPLAITPIILTIIFDSRVGILTTLTVALLTGMMNGYDYEFTTATIVASSMAVYSVRDIRNRSQFYLFTPSLIILSYFVVYIGFTLTKLSAFEEIGGHSIAILINAVLNLVLVYPLILLVEKSFNLTTDVALLELSDTNRPVLKELMTKATGTFHHSLQVANLAETAAMAIGARPLLCRVGALYHDIGKMEMPEYFVENQMGRNVHEKLKPSMSALVIRQHVTKGVERAEKENLPEVLIKFIKTHHGTSLIRYFYEKARVANEKEDISQEDYRYDGPRPDTKETGILMLADGVEAASRTLDQPNYQKLENLINRIFENILNDNQLENCPLTFQDLKKIKEAFLQILPSIYHNRVKYPDDKETDISRLPADLNTSGYEAHPQSSKEQQNEKREGADTSIPVSKEEVKEHNKDKESTQEEASEDRSENDDSENDKKDSSGSN